MPTTTRVVSTLVLLLGCFATQGARAQSDEMLAHLKARHHLYQVGQGWSAGPQECSSPHGACAMSAFGGTR
jgi:hypothetical protein